MKKFFNTGLLISIFGFALAVASVVIETNIHKQIRDDDETETKSNYKEEIFKKSLLSSFAEIAIFLGFILMHYAVIRHLKLKLFWFD